MKLRKAVITAAGKNQRNLPLQTLVDRDGKQKTALAIIVEEALAAGIEEIGVVVRPGDAQSYAEAASEHSGRLHFIEQSAPLGYGHAVWSARSFTSTDPFLLLVGDHLYISRQSFGCAKQLVEMAVEENCAVSAVQATHESRLPYFGAIGGKRIPNRNGLHEISEVLEKPTPTEAEQKLFVSGLRAGHYLCFFGMHVLTGSIMGILEILIGSRPSESGTSLSAALSMLSKHERYLAFEIQGRRYDLGGKYGLLTAQLALALDGAEREEVLAGLVDLLAHRGR